MQSRLLTGCQRVVLDALLSPVQSRLLTYAAGCQRVVLDASLSPVQSRLLTYAAGCQRVVLDALLPPVQSQLLTYAAGCQRVVVDTLLSPVQSRLLTYAAGCPRVVLDALLPPVQSRLLTCAAGVVGLSLSIVAGRSWGGVYVISGFTECSRRKLLARADDGHVHRGWLPANIFGYTELVFVIILSASSCLATIPERS